MADTNTNTFKYDKSDYTLQTKVNIGIKTLKNYRYLSLVYAVIAVLFIAIAVLTLVAYGVEEEFISDFGFSELENNFYGMSLFIMDVLLVISSAVLVFFSFLYYFSNTKKKITILNPILALISSAFSIVVTSLALTYFASSLVLMRGEIMLMPLWITLFLFGLFIVPGAAIPFGIFGIVKKKEFHLPSLKQIVVKKDFESKEEKEAARVKYTMKDIFGLISIILSLVCVALLFSSWIPPIGILFSSIIILYSGFSMVVGIFASAKESVKHYHFQRASLFINSILFFVAFLLLVTSISLTQAYGVTLI